MKLNQEMEKRRKIIVRSFSLARDIYERGRTMQPSKTADLDAGAEFLEVGHDSQQLYTTFIQSYALLTADLGRILWVQLNLLTLSHKFTCIIKLDYVNFAV